MENYLTKFGKTYERRKGRKLRPPKRGASKAGHHFPKKKAAGKKADNQKGDDTAGEREGAAKSPSQEKECCASFWPPKK